jgi:NAD(P)-dependent dehydrogenase (short-subunit alcohol dehydrogenase family)
MKKVLVVFGYGPGISKAVAEKFGAEGFAVALVARNRERLDAGVASLVAEGIDAAAFVGEAGDPVAVRRVIAEVRSRFGPITAIEWTAYGVAAGDVTTAGVDEVRAIFDVPIVGLLAAVQEALPDLKQSAGAVLVTNGGLGFFDDAIDRMGVEWNVMGLSIANSAKHKLMRLLSHRLKADGIFAGEVIVTGTVKGTAFDQGQGTIDATDVANAHWRLYTTRDQHAVTVG